MPHALEVLDKNLSAAFLCSLISLSFHINPRISRSLSFALSYSFYPHIYAEIKKIRFADYIFFCLQLP